jgi:hypothetical protein
MTNEFTPDEGPAQDVAWIVDALRWPARPDELDGGERTVNAMAAAIAGVKPTTLPHSRHGRRRIGVLVGIACVGIGGVAAAGAASVSRLDIVTPVSDEQPATTADSVLRPTTVTTTTSTPAPVPYVVSHDDNEGDEGNDRRDEDGTTDPGVAPAVVSSDEQATTTSFECAEGNHGTTVSSVAHATPPGSDHAAAIVTAAHSDCDSDDPDETSTTTVVIDTTAVPDTSVPPHTDDNRTARNANAGNDNGNGNRDSGNANAGNANAGNANAGNANAGNANAGTGNGNAGNGNAENGNANAGKSNDPNGHANGKGNAVEPAD